MFEIKCLFLLVLEIYIFFGFLRIYWIQCQLLSLLSLLINEIVLTWNVTQVLIQKKKKKNVTQVTKIKIKSDWSKTILII